MSLLNRNTKELVKDPVRSNAVNLNFIHVLKKKIVKDGIPILGICLGAQLFMSNSEEGKLKGLGWIEGNVRKFVFNNPQLLKVPHVLLPNRFRNRFLTWF